MLRELGPEKELSGNRGWWDWCTWNPEQLYGSMLQDPGLTWADTRRVEYYRIDKIHDRRGIRLLVQTRMEFLPTTAPSDQKSSTSATWPVTEASRASLVSNVAPSFSASTT